MLFATAEEAEKFLKERRLLFKLHQWAKIKNKNWRPNWSDANESKYYIYYDFDSDELDISCCYRSIEFNKLHYFKSYEITNECIEEFGDEIIEVLIKK